MSFNGNFEYRVITITDPAKLATRDVWQIRIILSLELDNLNFSTGSESDEVTFIEPEELKLSNQEVENKIFEYVKLALE